jgi:hypothetical protein
LDETSSTLRDSNSHHFAQKRVSQNVAGTKMPNARVGCPRSHASLHRHGRPPLDAERRRPLPRRATSAHALNRDGRAGATELQRAQGTGYGASLPQPPRPLRRVGRSVPLRQPISVAPSPSASRLPLREPHARTPLHLHRSALPPPPLHDRSAPPHSQ